MVISETYNTLKFKIVIRQLVIETMERTKNKNRFQKNFENRSSVL